MSFVNNWLLKIIIIYLSYLSENKNQSTKSKIVNVGVDWTLPPFGYWYCNSSEVWVKTSSKRGILIIKEQINDTRTKSRMD